MKKIVSLPRIVIKYNRFLDPIFIAYIKAQPQWKDWETPPIEKVHENIKKYKDIWEQYESKILTGMCDATGLIFFRNQIDVHVVSGNPRAFSSPLVIKSRLTPSELIDTVTHELIHCLFVDNETYSLKVEDVFPHDDHLTSVHIPVYAVMHYIYRDVLLKDESYFQEIEKSIKNPDYQTAWKIVKETGYKNILKKIKGELFSKK